MFINIRAITVINKAVLGFNKNAIYIHGGLLDKDLKWPFLQVKVQYFFHDYKSCIDAIFPIFKEI